LQPLTEFEDNYIPHHEEDVSSHSLGNHEGYETPHDDYGVPRIQEEYGPPPVLRIQEEYGPPAVTEQ
jgi:hypothetical protein